MRLAKFSIAVMILWPALCWSQTPTADSMCDLLKKNDLPETMRQPLQAKCLNVTAIDCSKVKSNMEIAAVMANLKFETAKQKALDYAPAMHKQRAEIVAKLGAEKFNMTGNEFAPGLRYVAITFEEGSVSAVLKCSPEGGLQVMTGSYALPKAGTSGSLN